MTVREMFKKLGYKKRAFDNTLKAVNKQVEELGWI